MDSAGKNTRMGGLALLQGDALPSSRGDLPDPGIKPASPVAPELQADSLLLSHGWSPGKLFEVKCSESCSVLLDSLQPHGLIQSMEFSKPEYWSG